ncbi:hypothetical protein [Streptomyces sp. NPDC057582]|uniref:hypothetical protein n=1 Tax=Streptomyces sp. NPDC057582 TaxID=3346174 RepID=UPI0036C04A83
MLRDQPERRTWHLGEAAMGPDETVAALPEEAARRRLRRGDALGAVAALTRAAGLSPSTADESRRPAEAAYVGVDSGGELDDASRLLAGARLVRPTTGQQSLHAAAASAFLPINRDGDIDTAYRLLVGAIEAGDHGWDASDAALVEALHLLVLLCWYGGTPDLFPPLFAFVDRLTPEPPELLWVITRTFSDPSRIGAAALPRLAELIATVGGRAHPRDPCGHRLGLHGPARGLPVGHPPAGRAGPSRDRARPPAPGRADAPRPGLLPPGPVGRRRAAGRRGAHLCADHDYRFYAWYFHYIQAVVAAARGDAETSAALAEEIVRWATPRGAHGAQFFAGHARALAALGDGDPEAAYQHACALSAPGTVTPYVPIAMWGAMDLVEAALRTGRNEEAAAHASAMRASAMAELSPRLELMVLACENCAGGGDGDFGIGTRLSPKGAAGALRLPPVNTVTPHSIGTTRSTCH